MSLEDLANAQQAAARQVELKKAYEGLADQLWLHLPEIVKVAESSPDLKELRLSTSFWKDRVVIGLADMGTEGSITIQRYSALIKDAEEGRFLLEMDVSYSGPDGGASYVSRVVVDRLKIPLAFKVGSLLRHHYPKHQAASNSTPFASNVGEYRLLWGGPQDNSRASRFLVDILRGEAPTSEYFFEDRYPPPKKDSRCFVATEIFGATAPETKWLCSFRDHVLAKKSWGRHIICVYYQSSPRVVEVVRKLPFTRCVARSILQMLLKILRARWSLRIDAAEEPCNPIGRADA